MKQRVTLARRIPARRLITHRPTLLILLALSITLFTSVIVMAADGDLDPSFDGDGIATTDHGEFEQVNDLVVQPDGKIVAVGHSGIFHNFIQEPQEMMIARYNSDGSLDATFGNGGIVTNGFGTFSRAWSVALQPDGKIVVGGQGGPMLNPSFLILRFNTDGSLDFTFGVGGGLLTTIGDSAIIADLAILADGKILAAGSATLPGEPVVTFVPTFVRYNGNGTLDDTFDGDGVAQITPPGFPDSRAPFPAGIALQADQKIVTAGTCPVESTVKFCLARYNPDISLDNTFAGDGIVFTDFDSSFGSIGEGVSIQPDGRIVAVGQIFLDSGSNLPGLVRYNLDGSLDSTFDGDGKVTTPNSFQFRVENLALQPNGQIVIVGEGFGFNTFMALARHNSDGSIDPAFGSGGIVTTSTVGNSGARTVAVPVDGSIITGGYANFVLREEDGAILSDFALVRYGAAVPQRPSATITGPASNSAFAVNTAVSFSGSFAAGAHSHFVIWIFESLTQPGVFADSSFNSLPGPINTTHTFTEPGVYKVTLVVLDPITFQSGIATEVDGLPAQVVIYDPDGSWISGGGWIDSPAGALVATPAATGMAHFNFVAKYKNSASVPTGNGKFQFNAGDLNFRSTSYEWLVASGGRAFFKGAGTINGSGSYQFMLTSIDGDEPGAGGADKFRIRIWSDSDGLIYDNQPGAPEFADPATALGGGNITIHR